MPTHRACSARARWLLVTSLVTVCSATLPAAPARADTTTWTTPATGGVVRPYQEPIATFAAGHRGMDFAAPAGTPVRAAGTGRVTFAGAVSGSQHVVIEHSGGIRTSYSFLARVDVAEGATVERGAVIGAAGGSGEGHAPGVLHFGARAGARYFDPMLLFGPIDLTELVRLVPVEPQTRTDEQMIADWLHRDDGGCGAFQLICDIGNAIGDAADWTWDRVEDLAELALEKLEELVEDVTDLIEEIKLIVHNLIETLKRVAAGIQEAVDELVEAIENGALAVLQALLELGIRLYEMLTSCPQPPSVAHPKGSGNFVVAVGGFRSSIERRRPPKHGDTLDESFQTKWGRLGYARDDVEYFSYDADSPTYTKHDTYTDLHEQARSLGEQIKAAAREHPGQAVDLVAHSMGGLVVDLFITEVYRGHEDEYPNLVNVVTFASPHKGTPIADVEESFNDNFILGPLVRLVDPTDVVGATSLDQMTTDSDTVNDLWDEGGVPEDINYLSISGSEDLIVPSQMTAVPGARRVVVQAGNPLWPDDHSAVVRDDDAISAAQTHLSGGSPEDSCGPLTDVVGLGWKHILDKLNEKVANLPGGSENMESLIKNLIFSLVVP